MTFAMEYKSRYSHPFTLEQAVMLEVPVITAEILRLQNSIALLRDTQRQLQENVDSEESPDPEILQALLENVEVISSQEERVSLLRLALELKGLVVQANPHYNLPASGSPSQGNPNCVPDSASAADGVFL